MIKVKFKNLIDATNFSTFASTLKFSNIDITCGRIAIDAKSLLGVINLDFSKVYDVHFSSCNKEETNLFLEYIKPLEVK